MDRKNLSDLKRLAPSDKAANKLSLLWENNEVPDPYYGDEDDFNAVFEIIDRACDTFVGKLLNR
jgi:protein-tyrosine phosphatase